MIGDNRPRRGHGMVLGKFMPPHLGHLYLVELARSYVESLSVVVGTLATEPIPGELRYRWMRELCPDCDVIHLDEELPQEPSEHPEFWNLWRESLTRVLPRKPDYVFASEPYGTPLAEILGAEFVPVDLARSVMPVSGTAVRADPMACWDYLPPPVRPHFVKRVCVFGPESTGKSTLTRKLAEEFQTVAVPEYARVLLEHKGRQVEPADLERMARGQLAAEEALARRANRVMICDTDVLSNVVWSETLFGQCAPWIRDEAARSRFDLTLLCDVDVPWVEDPVRYRPDDRRGFFERCQQALDAHGRRYLVVQGSWEERFRRAREAVEELIADPAAPAREAAGRRGAGRS